MLLTEKAELHLMFNKDEGIEINFKFNLRVIENLYYALKEEFICKRLNIESVTPLELLEKLDKGYDEGYFLLLLHSASDGRYDIDTLYKAIKEADIEDKQALCYIIKSIIVQSLIYIEPKSEEDKVETKENTKKENRNNWEMFEDWFNYYYTMSIDKLKLTLDEFYKATPAQIKERIYRINTDKKNTYILAYCEVMKARGESKVEDDTKVEEVTDMYSFINKM